MTLQRKYDLELEELALLFLWPELHLHSTIFIHPFSSHNIRLQNCRFRQQANYYVFNNVY